MSYWGFQKGKKFPKTGVKMGHYFEFGKLFMLIATTDSLYVAKLYGKSIKVYPRKHYLLGINLKAWTPW